MEDHHNSSGLLNNFRKGTFRTLIATNCIKLSLKLRLTQHGVQRPPINNFLKDTMEKHQVPIHPFTNTCMKLSWKLTKVYAFPMTQFQKQHLTRKPTWNGFQDSILCITQQDGKQSLMEPEWPDPQKQLHTWEIGSKQGRDKATPEVTWSRRIVDQANWFDEADRQSS